MFRIEHKVTNNIEKENGDIYSLILERETVQALKPLKLFLKCPSNLYKKYKIMSGQNVKTQYCLECRMICKLTYN